MNARSTYFVLSAACLSIALISQSFAAEGVPSREAGETVKPDIAKMKVKFKGSDSPQEIKTLEMIQGVQQDYISQQYKDYQTEMIMYIKDGDGRFIQMYSLKNEEGKKALIYFDMSDVYQRLKATRGKVKELEDAYMTIALEP